MQRKRVISLIIVLTLIGSYSFYKIKSPLATKRPKITATIADIQVKRLENELFALKTQEEILHFLQANQQFAQRFLAISSPSHEKEVASQLYNLVQDTAMHALYQEVQKVFGDFTAIQQQLAQAFGYLRYYYPSFQIPQVTTFITGMGADLYVDQDLMVIGLDFFLGQDAAFRPQLPNYMLNNYQPASIVPQLLLAIAKQFIQPAEQDYTLLSDMLAYGKAYYFTKALLPDIKDHLIIGYTTKQLADTQRNQHIVWEHFIAHKLLYETNHLIKKKYLGDQPFTAAIGPGCPGNIGGWLGWEIIKQYMYHNPQVSLSALMQNTEAKNILVASKYRPKK